MRDEPFHTKSTRSLQGSRMKARQSYESIEEKSCINVLEGFLSSVKLLACSAITRFFQHPETLSTKHIPQKYAYIFRRKSIWELILLSANACGVFFCYAAETAFLTPLLLSLGMEMKYLTMVWCISPLISCFLTSILGSMSDVCTSKIGRRRPFMIGLSVCILLGFFLVPYGRQIGLALGDMPFLKNLTSNSSRNINDFEGASHFIESRLGFSTAPGFYASTIPDVDIFTGESRELDDKNRSLSDAKEISSQNHLLQMWKFDKNTAFSEHSGKNVSNNRLLLRSVLFTFSGAILIDSCCGIFMSPSRAYMLDVTLPKDHAVGLSTFSIMSGLGAILGNVVGAVQWDFPLFGNLLEGQVIIVFAIISIVFATCMMLSLCFFPELPLSVLKNPESRKEYEERYLDSPEKQSCTKRNDVGNTEEEFFTDPPLDTVSEKNDGALEVLNLSQKTIEELPSSSDDVSLKRHLKSIIRMPKSLFLLCLVNLFTWMTIINYGYYFTNFMGEYVFGGSPHAEQNSTEYIRYNDGIRYGCWGRMISSSFIIVYSCFIESFIKNFGLKFVYIGGHIVGSIGFIIMIISKNGVVAIILSSLTGILYATAFTMPYLLITRYHSNRMEVYSSRGVGTDIAIVTSMSELSQFIVSLIIGSIVEATGSSAATIGAAAIAGACGAVSAFFVTYPDVKQTV